MAYGTSAGVAVWDAKAGALTDIAALVTSASAQVDPIIDAKLSGQGSPFTSAPTIVVTIASCLYASVIHKSKLSQADKGGNDFAETLWKRGMELLEQLASGVLSDSGVTSPGLLTWGDLNPEYQEDAVFVGGSPTRAPELDWDRRTETRE